MDQVVAHTSLEQQPAVLTYEELNAAIETVADLVKKYTSFLKAEAIAWFEPAIQIDWTAIFRQPWIQ